ATFILLTIYASCPLFAHALLTACHLVALRCPPGKEYQPCVSTCTSRTCLNREYYEETTCSFIREECVCRSGTILHRADSPYCVTEDRCGE
uniref:TIL domain-containing protein n=1 Tax=Stegastes partitus TaxID=144197 RepID=A0A3B5ACA8_9TELE